ncbi:20521_t:CDS:2, partial [Funneliformis geosporum]
MILSQLKTHISSRASYLFLADYKDIMQYRDMKRQEFNRIQWNDLAVTPTFTVLENKICDAKISKSTDQVFEESAGNKAKKTRGKKRSQGNQVTPGIKKEIISPTESSENVLDLYKRTDNTLEEIKAR